MLNYSSYDAELSWTTEAQLKLKKIPYFVRTQARQKIENLARANHQNRVTADIVQQARLKFGQ